LVAEILEFDGPEVISRTINTFQ